MTTTVLLIRHAAHNRLNRILCGRMPGVSISETGWDQAHALAGRLESANIAAIYSSPLERARETAAPLSERLGLAIKVDPRLGEIDFGAWTGLTFEALNDQPGWALWNTERSRCRPPNGETMMDVQRRLAIWLREVTAANTGQTIAAVSHADSIKAVVADIMGSSIDRLDRFAVEPASVTRIEVNDHGACVCSLNESLA